MNDKQEQVSNVGGGGGNAKSPIKEDKKSDMKWIKIAIAVLLALAVVFAVLSF